MTKLLRHAESDSSLGGPKTHLSEKSVSPIIHTVLLDVFVFLIGWAVAPGHLNADTINMFTQARTGVFHDWHSPIVSGIWFLLGAQPWVLVLTLFLILGGFAFFAYKLFRLAGFPHSRACIFTILTCYTPPVLGYLGSVCKDTLLAVLFLGILFLSICYHQRPRLSIGASERYDLCRSYFGSSGIYYYRRLVSPFGISFSTRVSPTSATEAPDS
jgi:hypothetical protein